MTLREAKASGKIDQFIAEHESDEPADTEKLEKIISSASQGKSKSVQGTSEPD